MKKKYGIAILSVLIIVVSTILLINKPSYAELIETPDNCPETVKISTEKENLSFIKTDYTTISLPKDINVKDSNGNNLDKEAIQLIRNKNIKELENKDLFSQENGTLNFLMYMIPRFSKDEEENRYYTQIALWWLIDKVEGVEDNYNYDLSTGEPLPIETSENEKYDENGNYKYLNQLSALEKKAIKESPNGKKIVEYMKTIDQLLDGGQSLSNSPEEGGEQLGDLNPITKEDITYHVTNDYIETNLITPTAKEQYSLYFKEYEVKVSSPMIVVDENGKEKTTFNSLEGFKLRIPISEINNQEINFKAQIIGKMALDQWEIYSDKKLEEENLISTKAAVSTSDLNEAVLINCGRMMTEQIFHPLEIDYKIEVGTLNIKVIDAESKEELSDAEVVIYDKSGNIVYRYKTTGDTLNITLPVGEYTVKQIITPPNYQARVVEQKVTITENGETNAVLENIQLVEVPDTLATATTITILGVIVTLLGTAIIITMVTKKRA